MSLATIMLDQLAISRRIIEDGHEVLPAWRIGTPDGAFLIFTPFDTDNSEQRYRALCLIARFMVWKMAMSFTLTAETWLGAGKHALAMKRCWQWACRTTSAWRRFSA